MESQSTCLGRCACQPPSVSVLPRNAAATCAGGLVCLTLYARKQPSRWNRKARALAVRVSATLGLGAPAQRSLDLRLAKCLRLAHGNGSR